MIPILIGFVIGAVLTHWILEMQDKKKRAGSVPVNPETLRKAWSNLYRLNGTRPIDDVNFRNLCRAIGLGDAPLNSESGTIEPKKG